MKTSTTRILTTHAGSLPRSDALIELNARREQGTASEEELAELLRSAVADVVRRQVECGVDIVNDGEYGKSMVNDVDYGAWLRYAYERLDGWEAGGEIQERQRLYLRDHEQFPSFYEEMWAEMNRGGSTSAVMTRIQTGPVRFIGHDAVARDVENLRVATEGLSFEQAFVTAVAPASYERGQDRYYDDWKSFLFALADALHEEYQTIVDAGFDLQIDEPSLADAWALSPRQDTFEEYRDAQRVKIEALNRALDGIPRDRVRLHVCWGSWHGPHTTDVPLSEIVDIVLEANVGAFSLEAGNVRHELDYQVWEQLDVPENLVLIPGVVSHATNLVEPPELVAERIVRYAQIVGRERVIAGTDCGLGGRLHPELAWAKLRTLSEGAKLASEQLWPKGPAR
jgi:5-methyltetrahydropteroyltriglutamate--homocysteine methyltransferase